MIERKANNIESSLQFYKNAFTRNPALKKALNNYGATLIVRGKYLKAKVYITRAKELKLDALDHYYNLAVIEAKVGNEEKKIQELFKLHLLKKEKKRLKDYNLGLNILNSNNY